MQSKLLKWQQREEDIFNQVEVLLEYLSECTKQPPEWDSDKAVIAAEALALIRIARINHYGSF